LGGEGLARKGRGGREPPSSSERNEPPVGTQMSVCNRGGGERLGLKVVEIEEYWGREILG
jgi:hypothetical protein